MFLIPLAEGREASFISRVQGLFVRQLIRYLLDTLSVFSDQNPGVRRVGAIASNALVEALDWSVIGTRYMELYDLPWWKGNGVS